MKLPERSFVPIANSKFERGSLCRIFKVGKEAGVPGTESKALSM